MNYGFIYELTCQSKYLSSKTDTTTTVCPLWWSEAKKKKQQDWVGFLAMLPWKPLFCPLPSCLAFLHTMRWKLNCLSSKQIGVVYGKRRGWRLGRLKGEKESWKNMPAEAKWSWNRWSMFTHWSFCFLRAACYLISGRQILSLTPSSTGPDSGVFIKWRNNKHPLRLDVCHSTKPQSKDVLLPPW